MKRLTLFFLITLYILKISLSFAYEDKFEKRINLWPIFVFYKNKKTNVERIEILGPIFYEYKSPKKKEFSIRPLYSSIKTSKEKKAYFLSPLGIYKSNSKVSTFKLFPIIKKTTYKTKNKSILKNFEFFPVFWGVTSDNKTYGGIFPIYGTLRNKLGAKKITFFLWPIYSKVDYKDYTALNILWPFIRIIEPKNPEAKKYYHGFKIWPFYGHFKENLIERKFILWPFYIKREDPFSHQLIIFPFYIKETTDTYKKWIFLWPFFQKVYTKDGSYKQIDAPWPFYRKIEGKNVQGLRIWPFYGYLKQKNTLSVFVLWPLYFYHLDIINFHHTHYKRVEHRFLLLSKISYVKENNISKKELRFWPFVYEYQLDSNSTHLKYWYFPAILPFHDEGIDLNYAPFLKLMEYYRKNNYTLFNLLWGLYRYERTGNRRVHELAFLFRMVKDKNTDYVEILDGLLGLGKIDGKTVIKILYIDLKK